MVINFFTFLWCPPAGRDSAAELFYFPPPLVYSSSTGFVHIFTLAVSGLFCFVTVDPLNLTSVCSWNGATHEWTLTEKGQWKSSQATADCGLLTRTGLSFTSISTIKHLFQSRRISRAVVCLSCQSAQSYQSACPVVSNGSLQIHMRKLNCVIWSWIVTLWSVYGWNASLFILVTEKKTTTLLCFAR